MARIIVDRIQVPSSTVAGEKPPSTLKHGELSVNTADGLVYAGVDGGTPVVIGNGGGGGGGGTLPSVLDSGVFV